MFFLPSPFTGVWISNLLFYVPRLAAAAGLRHTTETPPHVGPFCARIPQLTGMATARALLRASPASASLLVAAQLVETLRPIS